MLPYQEIEKQLSAAVLSLVPDATDETIKVRPCPNSKFGDYQSNVIMPIAKKRSMNPRQLATDVVAAIDVDSICEPVEIAGPGFLNFRLKPAALIQTLQAVAEDKLTFHCESENPQTIVIDFSSPNVAKPMHVGHIRSTILGESLKRVFRLQGHKVVGDNHIGDWGTQFGKLLVGWKTLLDRDALKADPIGEMERLYKTINDKCGEDEATLTEARQELVKLQDGDDENLSIWKEMIALSQDQFDTIYGRLDISFDETLGESFYNDRLKSVVEELQSKGLVRESQGAQVAFFDDIPELKEHPALVQKSDGAANYTTTDLATLDHRLETWNPDRIIYVTDARQQLHFRQLFTLFGRKTPDAKARLEHVWFGAILGDDGKPFKTREGDTIKLAELLDEAEEKGRDVCKAKNPDMSDAEVAEIGRVIGIGSVKYADLMQNRQSDYKFSWDKMLSLQGNTAPYLLYAYTRTRAMFRKAESQGIDASSRPESLKALEHAQELALAKHLCNFNVILDLASEECRPNYICDYLFELAGLISQFYENCPVLKSEGDQRAARLTLTHLASEVLKQGLTLLGLETTEQM